MASFGFLILRGTSGGAVSVSVRWAAVIVGGR